MPKVNIKYSISPSSVRHRLSTAKNGRSYPDDRDLQVTGHNKIMNEFCLDNNIHL